MILEVFHHLDAKSEIDVANAGGKKKEEGKGERWRKTRNIGCGARQLGFEVVGKGTKAEETWAWLKEAADSQHCLEDWGEVDSGISGS